MKYRMSVGAMLAALFAIAALSAPQPAAASGPAMALGATGNVLCDDPIRPTRCTAEFNADNPAAAQFAITVDATVIPQGGYAGFASEVVFGGLRYVQRAVCTDEVVWPDLAADVCFRTIGLAGQSQHGASTSIIPPFAKSNHSGALLELDVHCTDEDTHELLLTALPIAPFGAGYIGLDGRAVPVKTDGSRNLDLDGDGELDLDFRFGELTEYKLADSLEIECVAGALATPTPCTPAGCPTPTFTPTPTPCPLQGCPTATPRPRPRTLSPPMRPPAPEQLSPAFGRGGPLGVGGSPDSLPIAGNSAVAAGDDWFLIAILASMAAAALVAGAGAALYLRDER